MVQKQYAKAITVARNIPMDTCVDAGCDLPEPETFKCPLLQTAKAVECIHPWKSVAAACPNCPRRKGTKPKPKSTVSAQMQ